MATEPFIGEVRCFSFNFAPKGWAMCNGQLLSINSNQALFSILGTFYGGDGINTFALPNMQGNVPVHTGNNIVIGGTGGQASVLLTTSQINHTHAVKAAATANAATAAGNFPATVGSAAYGSSLNTTMNASIVSTAGGGQGHNNLQPYLVLVYCIALQGIFPSRN